VRGRFPAFLERFPTLEALAAAPLDDVLHAWQGLGYYRRARALHACANAVIAHHGGQIPERRDLLEALPGLGPYTAAALAAIAFDQPALPVDGNVTRVLARLLGLDLPRDEARRRLQAAPAELAPCHRPGDVAQALMDLGATVCRPQAPTCLACPWHDPCRARRAGQAEAWPRPPARRARPLKRGVAFVLRRGDGAILFRRRAPDGLLGGLHELPSSPWQTGALDLDQALAYAPDRVDWRLHPKTVRHVFTHFALELNLAEATTTRPPAGLWAPPDRFGELALPTVMRKVLGLAGLGPGDHQP
jgi:A/G-specific adenine glycosylase